MDLEDSITELGIAYSTAAWHHQGQTRADGVTPYIVHPLRVETLVSFWAEKKLLPFKPDMESLLRMRAAALLHDVVEDTDQTLEGLSMQFSEELVDLVDLLTKPDPTKPAGPDYYERIASDREALVVKCADRCANLEDARTAVEAGTDIERWNKYAFKTRRDVLPLYMRGDLGGLRQELRDRLAGLEDSLRGQGASPTVMFPVG